MLETKSLAYFPVNVSSTLKFIDEDQKEKLVEVVKNNGIQNFPHQQLCAADGDSQQSFHECEYFQLQYTVDRERFFVDLAVWKDYYSEYGDSENYLNDVLKLYREEDGYVPFRLKVVTASRGLRKQTESEHEFYEEISLLGTDFTDVYRTQGNRYVYYYSKGVGVVAFEEDDHLWVLSQ